MITGKIQSIQPVTGMKEGKTKAKQLVEYERMEVIFDGEITGYAVLNNFVPGAYKVGDTMELKGANQN